MLAEYGSIGLLLAVAIFFAVTTLLLPFFLSFPARLEHYLRRFRNYLMVHHPVLFNFLPPIPIPKKFLRFFQVAPYNPTPVKGSTFECGMETIGKAWVQFNFRYYFYALVFIALDVLVVFLYPWAVELKKLGSFGFIGVGVFIFVIIIGYIYAWKKKVLEWK